MSRTISLVSAAGAPALQQFASQLVAKASGNSAKLAAQAVAAGSIGVSVGPATPAGFHTAVTSLNGASGGALYSGVKATLFRAVLPKVADEPLALRDALDVLPNSGISSASEIEEAKKSFALTAAAAVASAKASGHVKITLLVKAQSKYANVNKIFAESLTAAAEGAGIAVETVGSAQATNALVLFPETLGTIATADTPSAETIEQAFAGILGGVSTRFLGAGVEAAGGNSTNSVARAVASAFRSNGLAAEAKKIEDAVAKATGTDGGKSILAAV